MANNCKFQKTQYRVSYDSGTTWQNVVPEQYGKGDLIEYDSPDCTSIDTLERWRLLGGQYICDGNNKYKKEIKEESYDNGWTWYVSYPTVYRAGEFVGYDEEFCCDKFVGHYIYDDTNERCPSGYIWNGYRCVVGRPTPIVFDPLKIVKCDGTTELTKYDVAYYQNSNFYLISAEINDSITRIGSDAFRDCSRLTSIDIPNGVTTIGNNVFFQCSGLTSCTIGSGVTSIGYEAFAYCSNLRSVTIYAETPPTLGSSAFNNTSLYLTIYVPSGSVYAYRNASGWSNYASKIEAIQT